MRAFCCLPSFFLGLALPPMEKIAIAHALCASSFFFPLLLSRRRGIALQRADIPMRPSQDFPVESDVELELPAPPEEAAEGK